MSEHVEAMVSTVVPVHNRAMLLREAVDSVLAQTHRPIEIIIVDDGSSDDTARTASALAQEHASIVRVLSQSNAGPGAARERGRQIVRGEFVQYLDSDDVLAPKKFERQVAALTAEPDADISYGVTRRYRRGGPIDERPIRATGASLKSLFPRVLQARLWATSTPLYRRGIVERAGSWRALWAEEDWEYDCRMAALSPRLCHVEGVLCDVRDHAFEQLHRSEPHRLRRYRDMARARELILAHAIGAHGVLGSHELRHFLRAMFLLARQCAAMGLEPQARRLLELAKSQRACARNRALDVALYDAISRMVGYRNVGRLSARIDRVRDRFGAHA